MYSLFQNLFGSSVAEVPVEVAQVEPEKIEEWVILSDDLDTMVGLSIIGRDYLNYYRRRTSMSPSTLNPNQSESTRGTGKNKFKKEKEKVIKYILQ